MTDRCPIVLPLLLCATSGVACCHVGLAGNHHQRVLRCDGDQSIRSITTVDGEMDGHWVVGGDNRSGEGGKLAGFCAEIVVELSKCVGFASILVGSEVSDAYVGDVGMPANLPQFCFLFV